MSRKKSVYLFILIFVLVAFASAEGQKEQTYDISFGHNFMPDSVHHKAIMKFKEEVARRSDNELIVSVFHSGQLGSPREQFEGLQVGSLEITMVPTARISGFVPQMQIFDLPFLFPSLEIRNSIMDGPIGRELLNTMNDQNVKGIGFYDDGFKQITSNKILRTPNDFKGLKFRTMESDIIMEQYKALGANPVPIDYSEVYNALQMGIVDGQENPIILIHDMKFYEVQDYLMLTNHAFLGGVLLYSTNWFEGLPKNLQDILVDEGEKLVQFVRQGVQEMEKARLKEIQDSGTVIVELTENERDALKRETLAVHDIYKNKYGADIVNKIYEAVDSY